VAEESAPGRGDADLVIARESEYSWGEPKKGAGGRGKNPKVPTAREVTTSSIGYRKTGNKREKRLPGKKKKSGHA